MKVWLYTLIETVKQNENVYNSVFTGLLVGNLVRFVHIFPTGRKVKRVSEKSTLSGIEVVVRIVGADEGRWIFGFVLKPYSVHPAETGVRSGRVFQESRENDINSKRIK